MVDDNEFDDGFTRDVRTALRDRASDLTAPPLLLPELRKRYGRRVAARRAGLVAVPLAVAAVLGAVVVTPGSAPPGSSSEVRTIGYVSERVGKALDQAERDRYVVQSMRSRVINGMHFVSRTWVPEDYSAVRTETTIDGVLDSDDMRSRDDPNVIRFLHQSRTWYTEARNGDFWVGRAFPHPERIKAELADDKLEVVGTEVVDGQAAIHLRKREDTPTGTDVPPFGLRLPPFDPYEDLHFTDLWVSESTYLPIRTDDIDHVWLPPTSENLALLKPPVPADYTRVPAP